MIDLVGQTAYINHLLRPINQSNRSIQKNIIFYVLPFGLSFEIV